MSSVAELAQQYHTPIPLHSSALLHDLLCAAAFSAAHANAMPMNNSHPAALRVFSSTLCRAAGSFSERAQLSSL